MPSTLFQLWLRWLLLGINVYQRGGKHEATQGCGFLKLKIQLPNATFLFMEPRS